MAIKVAINGFGRIGRMVLKAGLSDPSIEFVAINDLTDAKNLAYLFKYDSAQGRFKGTVEAKGDSIIINGKSIKVLAEKDPEKLPWGKLGIDVAVESTGFFETKQLASKHLKAGAKKVLVSAPCKCEAGEEPVKTIVMGCNENTYNGESLVSNASCTTNCVAPMVKVLNDNFGIIKCFMTTAHAYTASQKLVDGPDKKFSRGRAAAVNIVPTTSGATDAVALAIPDVEGKIDGIAVRVPIITGSMADVVALVEQDVTKEQINELFRNVSKYHMKGILEYNDDPIVSSDVIGNPHSCVFDANYTKVLKGNFIKIMGWYDNEYGYSCRMIDMIKLLARK